MNEFTEAKRIVVKVGTSTLAHATGRINIRRMEGLVKALADLCNQGKQVVLVSSGAIGVGVGKLGLPGRALGGGGGTRGLPGRPADRPSKQAAAAVGQCELMYLYDKLFSEYNHTVAQVLLTRDAVEDEARRGYVVGTFQRLLEYGCIPVVNENDTVAVEEIEFGDNDTLSALVAVLTGADALVLMSDIDGLFTADPREDPGARLIPVVEKLDKGVLALGGGAGSGLGTGGMVTKLRAAQTATAAGVHMAIINGNRPENLYKLFDGEQVGTRFLAERN